MVKNELVQGLEVYSCLPRRASRKPPLLFVHGAFAGAWMWTDTFLPFFAKAGYAAHAVSLRGHGNSHGREQIDWHSINDYVEDVAILAEHLGGMPVLIGHSMGGFVVQKYLEHAPAAGAALLCSVPPQGLVAAQFHLFLRRPQLFAEINRIMGGQGTDPAILRDALFHGEVEPALLDAWLSHMQSESHRAIWDMSMFNLPSLHRMHRPPMCVMGAEHDLLVPAFLVQSTAQTYGETAEIFRNMGHALTHEHDWPLVAAALLGWLETLRP